MSTATPSSVAGFPPLGDAVFPALERLAVLLEASGAWLVTTGGSQPLRFAWTRADGRTVSPAPKEGRRSLPSAWRERLGAGEVVREALDPSDGAVSAVCVVATGSPVGVLAVERAAGSPWPAHADPTLRLTAHLLASLVGTRRTAAVHRLLTTAVEQAAETVIVTDRQGSIVYANPAFERITGYRREAAIGQNPKMLQSGKHDAAFYQAMWETLMRGDVFSGHFINRKKDGMLYEEEVCISPVRDDQGDIVNFVAVKKDVTQEVALARQLAQCQKLEAVGQLAAGIAHEINTPTQFVGDNLRFLEESLTDLLSVTEGLRPLLEKAKETGSSPELVTAAETALEEADLEFLEGEIPSAIKQAQDGVRRIAEIVRAMKEFSHPGSKEKSPVDLNRAIKTATIVSRNVWKYAAELDLQLAADLPDVPCLAGEINQVLLNLIANAAYAIEEARPEGSKALGKITIRTERKGPFAEISIADSGTGIPEAIRDRILDPFFTTKEVGRGTGQGLAISRDVVVTQHGGELSFETAMGSGTTFFVRLPVDPPAEVESRQTA